MKTINNKKNLGKISCITMVAMTCAGLTGCGTKAEDVMKPFFPTYLYLFIFFIYTSSYY